MPSYDLACTACDAEFEVFLTRFLRDEDRVCPECGATDARQLLRAGFVSGVGGGPAGVELGGGGGGGCCGGSCGCGG